MGDSLIWPWNTATRWGKPDYGAGNRSPWPQDALSWLAFLRSVLGLATVVAVGSATRPAFEVLEDEGWGKSVTTIAIALGLVPLLMAVVHRNNRGRGLRWWPVAARWLLLLATSFGLMAPIILVSTDVIRVDGLEEWARGIGLWIILVGPPILALGVLSLVYVVWVGLYILTATMWALRTSLWSGVFHPLLAPVVGSALVVITTAVQLVGGDTKGVDRGLWLLMTFGGLLTTLAVAAAEYRSLRRAGTTWRLAQPAGPGVVP